MKIIACYSNKGGVGKTTVATNLAIYLRALYEDLPMLVVALDDQSAVANLSVDREACIRHLVKDQRVDVDIDTGVYGFELFEGQGRVRNEPAVGRIIIDRPELLGIIGADRIAGQVFDHRMLR